MAAMSSSPRSRVAVSSALLAACLGVSVALSATARADLADQKDKATKALAATKDQIDAAKDDLADTSAQLQSAYADLADSRGRLPGAQNAVAQARAAADAARLRNEQAIADLQAARAAEAKANDDLEATSAELADTRDEVDGFAAQLYQEQGMGSLSITLGASDAQDLADRMAMADNVADIQQGAIEQLSASTADLTAKQARLQAARDKVAQLQRETEAAAAAAKAAQGQAEAAQAELESLIAEQAAAADKLDAEAAKEKQRLVDLKADSDALTAKLADIGKQQAAAEAAAAAAAAEAAANTNNNSGGTSNAPTENPAPPASGGFLSAPSAGWISSEFGLRWHPILHYWRLHSGRDYAAGCGTPIYAAADGTIVSAGWGGGYGNQVVISHGIQRGVSLATTYNHMSQIVAYGGSIRRGQLVGYVGTTGLSTGCHLHFETRENGTPVDPRKWL